MATYNDLEKRIDALEEQFNGIITSLNNNKEYTDADIDGCRQSIGNITPTVITKQAYIDDTEVVFNNVPSGNITVYVENENGDFLNYSISRVTDMITVSFDKPLEYTATVTLSIL